VSAYVIETKIDLQSRSNQPAFGRDQFSFVEVKDRARTTNTDSLPLTEYDMQVELSHMTRDTRERVENIENAAVQGDR
jgi:hypothetical protein